MSRRWPSNHDPSGVHVPPSPRPTLRAMDPDVELLAGVRAGNEADFVTLVNRYNSSLLRVARGFVPSDAIAEEAVQETWMGVVRGVDRFEGRSSFKTWLFRILINRARSAGGREHRNLPMPVPEPAVDISRFDPSGAWDEPLVAWVSDADDRVVAGTWTKVLRSALDELPPRQREIVAPARRGGDGQRGRVRAARGHRGKPARAAAPRTEPAPVHAGGGDRREGTMMKLLRRRDELVCQQVVELVTEYLEGALPRSERKRFEYHLRHCPNCTNYLEQMRITIRATGTLQAEDLPPEALEEFTELFHRWRSEGGGGVTGSDVGGGSDWGAELRTGGAADRRSGGAATQPSTPRISPLVGTPVPAVTRACANVGHLVDRGSPDLAHTLGDAVHAVQVGLAQLAPVGVDGQPATDLDVAVAHEVLGLALAAEAELLELVEDVRGEVVVEDRGLDVGRGEARGLPELTGHRGHLAQAGQVVVVVRGHHLLAGAGPLGRGLDDHRRRREVARPGRGR